MVTIEATASKAWLHENMGACFGKDYYFDPEVRRTVDQACDAYLRETLPALGLVSGESNLTRPAYAPADRVLIGGIQPNMLLGMLLGADFIPQEGMDADISPAVWANRPIEDLPPPPSLLEHELVRKFGQQLRAEKAKSGRVAVPPFFWDASGRAAIHGLLTTAQKFRGEGFFLEMMTDAQAAQDLISWIRESFTVLVHHFAKTGGFAIDGLHVGECSACMVNPELLETFIVRELSRLGRNLAPLRLHSCGPSTHLLDTFARIEGLVSLDLGGETSIAEVRRIFGGGFPVSIAPLVSDLCNTDPGPLLAWAERAIEENQGGPLVVVYHLEPGYCIETLRALHTKISFFVEAQED